MRAIVNGVTIADSNNTILLEGNHYFPPENVNERLLKRSWMRSACPWKGVAAYYHVEAEGGPNVNAAWTYRHPFPWIRKIKDHVAFCGAVEVRP